MIIIRPILKWAGGKRQLLNTINRLKPQDFNRYIEPFCGGAAVYFNLCPNNAIIGDKNKDLINCYKQVRDNLSYVKRELNLHTKYHNEKYYYEMRDKFNARRRNSKLKLNSVDAALMIYLNKAGFNGMFRENLKGDFNIPSGKKKSVVLYENDNLEKCSKQLKYTEILCADFEDIAREAEMNDFVFFDSPYDDTFHTYQAGGFTKTDHERLANLFYDLTNRGVYCMLTNNATDYIKSLYTDQRYSCKEVSVRRMISSNSSRPIETEIIITNYPIIEEQLTLFEN